MGSRTKVEAPSSDEASREVDRPSGDLAEERAARTGGEPDGQAEDRADDAEARPLRAEGRVPAVGDWIRVKVTPSRNGGVDEAQALVTAVGRSDEPGGAQVRVNVRVFPDASDTVPSMTGIPLYGSRRDAETAPVTADRGHVGWWPDES